MTLETDEAEQRGTVGTSSPMMTLFRADLRRIWSGRTIRTAGLVVLGILLLQVVVGVLIPQVRTTIGTTAWTWAMSAASTLGLYTPWASALLEALGVSQGSTARFFRAEPMWTVIPLGIAGVIVQMLLPAFAAMSIAPDRESRRLDELLLAGFTPRQLLLAKGLAALFPLLMLWLVTRLLNLVVWFVFTRDALPGTPAALQAALQASQGPVSLLLTTLAFLARCGTLVCLSALCRRYQTAMQGCYAFAFLLFPILQILALAPFAFLRPTPASWPGYFLYTPTVLSVVCFAVLLRLALRALANPDEPRDTSRRPRATAEPIP